MWKDQIVNLARHHQSFYIYYNYYTISYHHHNRYQQKHAKAKHFDAEIGTYVMVAAKQHRSKLESSWIGPYVVTAERGTHRREVRSLLDDSVEEVHVARLLRFHNRLLHSPAVLKEQAGYLNEGFEVQEVLSHEKRGRQYWVEVHWKGFTIEDNTMEPLETIAGVAAKQVEEYLHGVSTGDPVVRYFSRLKKSLGEP